ncbi:MAG: hypothetical protein C5B50_21525 [Verrucomicrobia bacterium]|nr:MAG: hypothetical protein C5B50_21525 [Verrucomicrobiota bacterium]
MKKLVLLIAIMFGGIAASQAGVHVGFGLTLPVPFVAPAPVYSTPAPCYPAPVYSCPPAVAYSAPYCAPAPSVYFRFGPSWGHYYGGWHHGYGYGHGWNHGWHHGGHWR